MMTSILNTILCTILLISGVTYALGGEPEMQEKSELPIGVRTLRDHEIYVDYFGISPDAESSARKKSKPGEGEKIEVGLRLSSTLLKHGIQLAIEHLNAPSVPNSNGLGGFPGDRSFSVEIVNWKLLNEDVVLDLAKELGRQPNRWRVILSGRVRECAFTIYQDCVAFDASVLRDSLAGSIRRVSELESQAYDNSQGNSDRQLEQVEDRFRTSFIIERQRSHIVAEFDNWRGEKSSCVIWVFHTGKEYDDYKLEPAQDSMGKKFEVKRDGSLHKLYELVPRERAGYLIESVRATPLNDTMTFQLNPTN